MSGPINEVALLLKTSVMSPLKQLALILKVFSKLTAMDHARVIIICIAKVRITSCL